MKSPSLHLSSRTFLVGGPVFLLLLAPFWFSPLRNFLTPPPLEFEQSPDQRAAQQTFLLEKLTFYQTEGNLQQMRLTAERAFSQDTDSQITLSGVVAELMNEKGKAISIESREALYDTPKQEVTLQHSVTLQTDDFIGNTEQLSFYPEVKLVQTTEEVSLARPGMLIKGTGLNYDLGSGELVIGGYGRVYCTIE